MIPWIVRTHKPIRKSHETARARELALVIFCLAEFWGEILKVKDFKIYTNRTHRQWRFRPLLAVLNCSLSAVFLGRNVVVVVVVVVVFLCSSSSSSSALIVDWGNKIAASVSSPVIYGGIIVANLLTLKCCCGVKPASLQVGQRKWTTSDSTLCSLFYITHKTHVY